RADVAVRRLVEVDDHRRVVARTFALARVAVHPGGLDAVGDVVAGQDEVDPHAAVLVEHPGAVVPVGEDPLVWPPLAHDVAQAAETARASGCGKPGAPSIPRTTSERPAFETIATPFQVASPWAATS